MMELIYDDADGTHRVPIKGTLTFGRSSDNDVVLRDFSVSRYHARIEVEKGVARVTDLDSTNGVKINETLVASGPLAAGDRLTIGSFVLVVEDSLDSQAGLSSPSPWESGTWRTHGRTSCELGKRSSVTGAMPERDGACHNIRTRETNQR